MPLNKETKQNQFLIIVLKLNGGECPHGAMATLLDSDLEISKFEFRLCYLIPFRINTLGKSMNPLLPN